jgi:hypothetical protein
MKGFLVKVTHESVRFRYLIIPFGLLRLYISLEFVQVFPQAISTFFMPGVPRLKMQTSVVVYCLNDLMDRHVPSFTDRSAPFPWHHPLLATMHQPLPSPSTVHRAFSKFLLYFSLAPLVLMYVPEAWSISPQGSLTTYESPSLPMTQIQCPPPEGADAGP